MKHLITFISNFPSHLWKIPVRWWMWTLETFHVGIVLHLDWSFPSSFHPAAQFSSVPVVGQVEVVASSLGEMMVA